MAAGRRYYTLASQTLPKSTIVTDTTSMLLPGQVHMPRPTPPPYVVAKTLTQYFFGETTLPSFLQRYGDILLAITGGAAAATSIFWYFQRNKYNRKRIRLAVFHVVRTLQKMPNLEELIKTPEEFYEEIDYEVSRMIGIHLTQSEGVTIAKRAQRQLEAEYNANVRDLEDERRVRRRLDDAADGEDADSSRGRVVEEEQISEPDIAGDVPETAVQSPSSAGQPEESPVNQDEVQQDDELDMGMLGYNPTASHLSPGRERPPLTSSDIDLDFGLPRLPSSAQSRRSRGNPSSLGSVDEYSSSPPARPSNPTPRRGRNGPFSSDDTPSPQRLGPVDLFSEDVFAGGDEQPILRPSNPTPHRARGSTDVQSDTPRPKTARRNRRDLEQESHDLYTSPASRDDTSPVHESPRPLITSKAIRERREKERVSNAVKTAQKPRSTIPLRQPPSAMEMRTEGEFPRHRLSSIREGLSPHVSPAVDAKQYRVAETRRLNRQLQDERNERPNFRKHVPQIGEETRGNEEEQHAEGADARRQEGTLRRPNQIFDFNRSYRDGLASSPSRQPITCCCGSILFAEIKAIISGSDQRTIAKVGGPKPTRKDYEEGGGGTCKDACKDTCEDTCEARGSTDNRDAEERKN
ncbi:hypothetical protein J4E90_007813 [Alternaria incomplexa]|uniref:uncharacterized protein n=1 Tax=Alternaria incomplexa TaxID=1187928 RepID=UPI00221F4A98|nr:uncharacterized protein J4E90_007813 [Alternaria incomplexa]KAI4910378.1 hypothetical protein J4E90_007813 [Alternaria incomplexa]